jgi:hypothetical protein
VGCVFVFESMKVRISGGVGLRRGVIDIDTPTTGRYLPSTPHMPSHINTIGTWRQPGDMVWDRGNVYSHHRSKG